MNRFRRSARSRRVPHEARRRRLRSELLEARQLLAADANPFHNDHLPTDINGDGTTTVGDLRLSFADLSSNGSRELMGPLTAEGESGSNRFVDVNADGMVTPADLRNVYNAILSGEGEANMQMEFFMDLKDTGGNPVTLATVGQTVILDIDIRDARIADADNPDGTPMWPGLNDSSDLQGVFSAYFDFAHSTNLSNAAEPDEFPCNFDLFTQNFLANCQYDHQDYDTINKGPSFPTVTTEVNDNGTPGDTSDDFEETVINDLGGVAFTAFQTNRVNLVDIHLQVDGTDLTAEDDTAETDETTPITIPVLNNDGVMSELFFERREATGASSEVAFLRGGEPNDPSQDDLSVITPEEIFGDMRLEVPISGVALGGLNILSVSSGSAQVGDNGTPGDTSDDVIDYTPAAGGPGSAQIVYEITDGVGSTATATVTVSIGSENDPPTHTTPQLSGNEEQPIPFTGVTVSDIDADSGQLTTTVTANDGTLTATVGGSPVAGPQIVINGTLTQINAALATMAFTGDEDFVGTTSAEISTNDNGNTGDGGAKTTTDTITIVVANVNDDPVVTVPGAQSVADDDTLAFAGSVNVDDVDSDSMQVALDLSSTTGASGQIGVLTLGVTSGVTFVSGANNSESMTIQGSLADVRSALTSLSYTPDDLSGFLGTVTVSVAADDLDGGSDSDSFDIDVEAGVLPRARRDAATADEDSSNNLIDVLDNDLTTDSSSDAFLVENSFTQPANGTVTLDDGGTPQDRTDDQLIYEPDPNFAGTDSFTYVMDETPTQGGLPSTGTVVVTVTEENDAPTAADLETTFEEDEVVTNAEFAALLASLPTTPGGGADESTQSLTVTSVTALTSGATVTTTSLSFDTDYNNDIGGPFQFEYVVTDNGTTDGQPDAKSATATVTINLTPVNDKPIGDDDGPLDATEDTSATISISSLLSNDAPGRATATDETASQSVTFFGLDAAGATTAATAGGGAVTVSGNDIIYSPATDFNGPDSFTYVIDDGESANNLSDLITVSLDVEAVNDAPIANPDSNDDAIKGVPLTIPVADLLANDEPGPATAVDEASQPLSITGVQSTSGNATVELVGNNLVYTANSDFSGQDTFTYTLSDGQAVNSTATGAVTIDVADFVPSSFSGHVYVDSNNDGGMTSVEQTLAGITITLTGADTSGETVPTMTTVTDANGHYSFDNLVPGSYNITQTQPQFFLDGAETAGTTNAVTLAGNDAFNFEVDSAGGLDSDNNNFAEIGLHPLYFSLEELRASLPDSGAVIGTNTSGDQLWFSTLGSWDSMGSDVVVAASVAADMTTVEISITYGDGSSQSQAFDTTSDRRVRIMGSDGSGHVIRVEGDLDDLFSAAEAEGEPSQPSLDEDIELLAASRHGGGDVDGLFSQFG